MTTLYGTTSRKSLIAAVVIASILVFIFMVGLCVTLYHYMRTKPGEQMKALYPKDLESAPGSAPVSVSASASASSGGLVEKEEPTGTGSSEGSLKSTRGTEEEKGKTRVIDMSRRSSASEGSRDLNLNGLKPVEPAAVG